MSKNARQRELNRAIGKSASGQFTATFPSLLSASLLLMCAACSTTQSGTRTPELPANLAADCPELPPLPSPFIDPARALWEEAMIALYGECAGRHARAVAAR